jgi:twitching motility protein PilT
MISFDQSLMDLVQRRLVTYEDALAHATNPDDFALRYRGIGRGTDAIDPSDGGGGGPDLDLAGGRGDLDLDT